VVVVGFSFNPEPAATESKEGERNAKCKTENEKRRMKTEDLPILHFAFSVLHFSLPC
jgi:hypothetical protein